MVYVSRLISSTECVAPNRYGIIPNRFNNNSNWTAVVRRQFRSIIIKANSLAHPTGIILITSTWIARLLPSLEIDISNFSALSNPAFRIFLEKQANLAISHKYHQIRIRIFLYLSQWRQGMMRWS